MTDPRSRLGLHRREFLRRAGLLAGGLAVAPSILAACGSSKKDSGGNGASTSPGSSGAGAQTGTVSISNWTSYMTDQSKADFQKATGLKLTYTEDINDNNEYFAKIQPNLSKGKGIGRDGIVLTDWMANRLINQLQPRWVQPFDEAKFPNKKNLRAALRSPGFDPNRTYSAPWASGMTGIAYNIKITKKEIKTIDDFLAVSGSKTVLTEMRDTVGLFMLADGKDITKPTFADAQGAFDKLDQAVADNKINGFNGNEYVNDLGSGNLTAAFAWSGDVAQITLDNPDVRFAIPDSGGTLWSDNFMIPIGTTHVDWGTEWINFFYDPKNAAVLTAGIQYVSPVDGVADELAKMGGDAAKLVSNPLVVPTEDFLKTLNIFGPLEENEEQQFDQRFSQILGSG